jgi:hypothetical protein
MRVRCPHATRSQPPGECPRVNRGSSRNYCAPPGYGGGYSAGRYYPDGVVITAEASVLVRTMAWGSASRSAIATIRMEPAATMTEGATGSRLRATSHRVTTTVTD